MLAGDERKDHEPRRQRGEAPGKEWMAVQLVVVGRKGGSPSWLLTICMGLHITEG